MINSLSEKIHCAFGRRKRIAKIQVHAVLLAIFSAAPAVAETVRLSCTQDNGKNAGINLFTEADGTHYTKGDGPKRIKTTVTKGYRTIAIYANFNFPLNGDKPPASSRSASANLLLIFSPVF